MRQCTILLRDCNRPRTATVTGASANRLRCRLLTSRCCGGRPARLPPVRGCGGVRPAAQAQLHEPLHLLRDRQWHAQGAKHVHATCRYVQCSEHTIAVQRFRPGCYHDRRPDAHLRSENARADSEAARRALLYALLVAAQPAALSCAAVGSGPVPSWSRASTKQIAQGCE